MTPFAATIAGWAGFYQLAGLAAAALAGLLFVTLSLHVDVLANERSRVLRTLARQTLTNFIVVVVMSMLFQVPDALPTSIGVPLAAMGAAGLFEELRLGLRIGRLGGRDRWLIPGNLTGLRTAGRAGSYAAVVVVAVRLILGDTDGLYWIGIALIVILVSATSNSWDLLIHLTSLKRTREAGRSPQRTPAGASAVPPPA